MSRPSKPSPSTARTLVVRYAGKPMPNSSCVPCHGGVYYKNGEVAAGPPPHALQQFPVRILNNAVQVEWRKLPPVAGKGPCPGHTHNTGVEA